MFATPGVTGTGENIDFASLPVSIDDVRSARERIMPHLLRTPLVASPELGASTGHQLLFKAENLQMTGSFKARGALNALILMSDEQRSRGVTTFSAGNHGAGLAYAASLLGVRCRVYMAKTAVPAKVDAIRSYGAEAAFGDTIADALAAMHRAIEDEGLVFLSPFDDPGVVAGQGVIGLEILEDATDIDAIVVPIGGGGMSAGISLVVKALRPDIEVIGVEPVGAAAVTKSLETGTVATLDSVSTIADGLAAPFAGEITQAIISKCVDRVVLVSDDDIAAAVRSIVTRAKLVAEPAGAAAYAALAGGVSGVEQGSRVVCMLSGGNIGVDRLIEFLSQS